MGHGRHWQTLYPDLQTFVDHKLPALVNELSVFHDQSWVGPAEPISDIDPARLMYLCEDDGDLRHLLVVAEDKSGTQHSLLGAFPFCCAGIVHELVLIDIEPGETPAEAVLTAEFGEGERVAFFDPLFGVNRDKYRIGRRYPFRFAAIAYDLQAPDRDHIEIADPVRSREVRNMIRTAGGHATDGDGPLLLELEGAAMMFPITEWQRGDYSFYAPVRELTECRFDGRRISEFQITPRRLAGRDVDVVLYAAAHRIGEGLRPQTGVDVTGAFWLQAHLAD